MELKVYLENLYCYTIGKSVGEWITLPMEENSLDKVINKILGKNEELIITDSSFKIEQYEDIREYNRLFLAAQEEHKVFDAIALLNYDLWVKPKDVLKSLEEGNYNIIEAEDNIELGKEVVKNGLLGEICETILKLPSHYIDYEQIGEEYIINNNATEWKYEVDGEMKNCYIFMS